VAEAKSARLKDKIASLREQMRRYKALEAAVRAAPDKQISLTDADARSMATRGKDTSMVGYNAQAVVEAQSMSEERSSCDLFPPANVAHQHIAGNMPF
jgi:transposase